MPIGFNEDIARINEKHLSFFLKRGKDSSSRNISTSSDYDTRICGENINIGGVHIAEDGYIYNSGAMRVDAIAIESGLIGDRVRITTTKPVEIPDANFETGAEVWLVYDIPNLTSILPEPEDDMIIQKVGIAGSATELLPNIEQAFIVNI